MCPKIAYQSQSEFKERFVDITYKVVLVVDTQKEF